MSSLKAEIIPERNELPHFLSKVMLLLVKVNFNVASSLKGGHKCMPQAVRGKQRTCLNMLFEKLGNELELGSGTGL